jgi:uncharacterized protein RhaS with RHS repeats
MMKRRGYYNRHRHYDPLQGWYIKQDPVGLWEGWNPYTYPLNPVTEFVFMSIGSPFISMNALELGAAT